MRQTLKITRNGNASTVTIPRRMLDFLRWRAGDTVTVELTVRRTIEVRETTMLDLREGAPGITEPRQLAGVKA